MLIIMFKDGTTKEITTEVNAKKVMMLIKQSEDTKECYMRIEQVIFKLDEVLWIEYKEEK